MKQNRIIWLLVLGCILLIIIILPKYLSYKSNLRENTNSNQEKGDMLLLNVGNFNITLNDFINLNPTDDIKSLSKEQVGEIFNTLITTGLIIERAKYLGYEQDEEVIKQLSFIKNKLHVDFIKKNNTNRGDVTVIQSDNENDNFLIDYVWIPKSHKKEAKDIYKLLRKVGSLEGLLKTSNVNIWRETGVKIYQSVYIKDIIPFNNKILEKARTLNYGDLEIIKGHTGYYILMPTIHVYKNSQNKNLSNFSNYSYNSSYDNILFSSIESNRNIFSLIYPPITSLKENDLDIIAEYNTKLLTKEEFLQKIKRLPQTAQALFRNRDTRINATVSLIMMINGFHPVSEKERKLNAIKEKLVVEKLLKKELEKNNSSDTIGYITNWLKQFTSGDSLSRLEHEFLKQKIDYIHLFENNVELANKYIKQSDENVNNELYPWLYPECFDGTEKLKINFHLLEKLGIPKYNLIDDEKIIASAKTKTLSIKELEDELKKMRVATRIKICKERRYAELIEHIINQPGTQREEEIYINDKLFKYVDFLGDIPENGEGYVSEDDIVTNLDGAKLTLNNLREKVSSLPKNEIEKFWKKDMLNLKNLRELIIEDFWLKQAENDDFEEQEVYQNMLNQYKNRILIETFYDREIGGFNINIENQEWNEYINIAINNFNEDLLRRHISVSLENTSVNISKRLFDYFPITKEDIKYKFKLID